MKNNLKVLAFAAAAAFQTGCETSSTQKNLADGTEVRKDGWFRMTAEKEQLEPHEQRREDAAYLGRKK